MWKSCIALVWMVVFSLLASAQTVDLLEEDLQRSRNCNRNIQEWLRMLEIKASPGLMEDLADCYACIHNHEAAVKWYEEALEAGNTHVDIYRKLAISRKEIGDYNQAMMEMRRFAHHVGESRELAEFLQSCEVLIENQFKGGRFVVEQIDALGTKQSEIPACRHLGDLYFYSRAPKSRLGSKRYKGSQGRPYSLYCVPLHEMGKRRAIRVLSRNAYPRDKFLGLVWDESCSDYYIVKVEQREDGENPPAIFRSWIDYHGQVHEEKMFFNGNSIAHSNFHPAIDRTGHYMVFASDREGGFGGIDLYYCFRDKEAWSEPQNLGPLVNTVRDETFPSFSAGGVLYFASDGYPGFGRMDVYSTELTAEGWSAAINVGAAINSDADDFGLVWDPVSQDHSGYFCSDRIPGRKCELFRFYRAPQVMGRVVNAVTGLPLEGATITISSPGIEPVTLTSGVDGAYSAYLDPDRAYTLSAEYVGYNLEEWDIQASKIGQGSDCRLDLAMNPVSSFTISGKLLSSGNGQLLDDVTMRVIHARTGEELRYDVLRNGEYTLTLGVGEDYAVLFQHQGFNSLALTLPLSQFQGRRSETRDLSLKPGNQVLLVGKVTDAKGERMEGVSRIDVMHLKTKELLHSTETDRMGNFSVWIDRDWVGSYALFASHEGHASTHVHILTDDDKFFPFHLNPQNLTMQFASAELHHDFGRREVSDNSQEVMDDIYLYLLRNPGVSMELRTYADSRGSAEDNAALSEQRALAILNDLLLRGGITQDRLRHVHFGESRPKNECVDGINCPEEKHAENRRTEVYFFATPAPRASK